MQRVQRVSLEIDSQLYRLLQGAAQANNLSLEEECLRRLLGGERRSRYLQALVAECSGQGVMGSLALCAAMLRALAKRDAATEDSRKLDQLDRGEG